MVLRMGKILRRLMAFLVSFVDGEDSDDETYLR